MDVMSGQKRMSLGECGGRVGKTSGLNDRTPHKPLIWEHIPWRGRLPLVSVEHMSDTVSVPFSLSLELSP